MKPLSVGEISTYLTNIFNSEELLHSIKIYGEISGMSVVRGNAYFTVKDESAILNCIMFGMPEKSNFKNGDQVLLEGSIGYYSKGGKVNFYTTNIMPYGLGMLYQKFLELKEKLQQEGLFDQKYKKTLPAVIKHVGIITSETGAVLHDIINIASRRNPFLNLYLYPAKVQGEGADISVIEGINYFQDKQIDVLIIARGGGSFEDLQAFNSEKLARVAFNSKIPIISAIGHETDFTILDFVASLRAPTPSAAAEIVSKDISGEVLNVTTLVSRLLKAQEVFYKQRVDKVNLSFNFIDNKFKTFYDSFISKTIFFVEGIKNAININILNIKHNIERYSNVLNNLNPAAMLLRGYSQIYGKDGIVGSVKQVEPKDNLKLLLKDGTIDAVVLGKKENN